MPRHAHPEDLTAEHPIVRAGQVDATATNPLGIPAQRPAPALEPPEADPAPGTRPTKERPQLHDGSTGNPIRRAEPKVRRASLAGLLTPIALYYGHQLVPGVEHMPVAALLSVDSILTGAAVFVAGFLAKAVDRWDLFAAAE